ncbi:hypothetical protein CF327_g1868 [Tilletia walkeri]|nr:hypothetical protein CF327_g1868 [Tilletia walkeri]
MRSVTRRAATLNNCANLSAFRATRQHLLSSATAASRANSPSAYILRKDPYASASSNNTCSTRAFASSNPKPSQLCWTQTTPRSTSLRRLASETRPPLSSAFRHEARRTRFSTSYFHNMDNNRYNSSSSPSPGPSSQQSLTGLNVRSRAMDMASRAKARATSAYAVAAAAASSSGTTSPDEVSVAGDTPSSAASLARLANGARVRASNAFERAAGAISEGIDREREREWQRRSGQQAAAAGYNGRPDAFRFEEGDDPDTPRPSAAQLQKPVPPPPSGYSQSQNTPTMGQTQSGRQYSSSSDAPWTAAFSGRSSLEQTRMTNQRRSNLDPGLPSARPPMTSSDSSSSMGPTFARLQDAARRKLAAAAASKSFQGAAGLLDRNGEGRRTSVDLDRDRTMRAAYSTVPNRRPNNPGVERSDQGDAPQGSGTLKPNHGSKGRRSFSSLAPVAPGMPLHAPGSEEAVLLPGWAVRRPPGKQQQKGLSAETPESGGSDIHILLSGVVLRTPETPSRSQRIFLRLAKQIAALPKMNSPASSFSLADGTTRTRLPIVVPNFSGAPLSDEPSQVDDLSAFSSIDSQNRPLAALSGLASPELSAKQSSSSSSSSSAAFSNPSSPMLHPEDGGYLPLTDRIIQKVVQGGNDDLILRAMERIGAFPTDGKPPTPPEYEVERMNGELGTGSRVEDDIVQSPTVLGADEAFSAKVAEGAVCELDQHDMSTDAIPPLSLDTSVNSERGGYESSLPSATSSNTSPSKLRKLFGSGLGSSGESPKLGPSTGPGTPSGGGSGAATPITMSRNESSSRLSRFAESVKRRASYAPDSSSLSSSVSSVSSGAGLSPRIQPSNGPSTSSLSWPSGSGVWSDRSFEQLLTLQQNLDSRLRAFWTHRVPDRHVWIEILPVFRGEDEKDVFFGAPSSSSSASSSSASSVSSVSEHDFATDTTSTRKRMSRPLLAATKARSNVTGQFHDKFVIPWHKLDAYCRAFFSGSDGSEARRPEDIVCIKKRAVLLESTSPPSDHEGLEVGRWVHTDVDNDDPDSPSVRIISDVDDTVKRSDVTQGVRRIFHSVFVKPFEEVQIPGVAEWYQNLRHQGGVGFHFVSNTPLELHGLVRGFLESAGFPRAHLHLKHYAIGTRNLFTSWLEPAGERKKGAVVAILEDFPSSKFILIGDSGELDMELYTAIAAERRAQILGIFIRNVSSSIRPDAALHLGNAAVGAGRLGEGLGGGGGGAKKPLFKRNATVGALPTLEPDILNGDGSQSALKGIDDKLRPGAISDDLGIGTNPSSSSSFAAAAAAAAVGANGGAATSNTDEARRKRDAAFAVRVQRARAICPPEIPLLFYTRGEKATTDIALDMIAKAKAKAASSDARK